MAKNCTYTVPGLPKALSENEFKAYLLNGGLDSYVKEGIEVKGYTPQAEAAPAPIVNDEGRRVVDKPKLLKEDYDLSKDNESEAMYDIGDGLGFVQYGYKKYGDTVIRIKNHTPDWSNFVEDIEDNGVKKVINVTVGDYRNSDKRKNKTTMEEMQQRYPDVEFKDIRVEDGESVNDAINKIHSELNPEQSLSKEQGGGQSNVVEVKWNKDKNYRVVETANEAIGKDVSFKKGEPFDDGAFTLEFSGGEGKQIEHHEGSVRGNNENAKVEKIYFDTDYWDSSETLDKELNKMKEKFPDAEFIPIKTNQDLKTVIDTDFGKPEEYIPKSATRSAQSLSKEQGGGGQAIQPVKNEKTETVTETTAEVPPIPPKPPETEQGVGEEDKKEKRRFSQQVLADEEILPGIKKGVKTNLEYARQTNAVTVAQAQEILNRVGLDEAFNLVTNDPEVNPAVRVVLGETLIKEYNELAKKANEKGDTETEDYYIDKSIDVANYVSEKLGTEGGRMIQAFSLYSRLSVGAQLRAASQDVKQEAKRRKEKSKKNVDDIGNKFQKVNEETAEQITSDKKFKEKVEKTESSRVKKAKDKIQQAKKKREDIINKYKKGKGGSLYAGVGLTKEGIEFVGDLVATYIQEGVANLEIVIDKVLENLKEVAGKDINDEVQRNVQDIVAEKLYRIENDRIRKGLVELEKSIGKIVREHYTVPGDTKKSLIDKFVEQTGLDKEDATQLANEVEKEFDRIATRKKQDILYKEKEKLEKIKENLDRKGDKTAKTLGDEMIKYSNLGAFDNNDFLNLLAKKLEVDKLTTEEAKKIQQLAEKIQKAPEGSPKNAATQELLAYRANMKGIGLMETLQAVWYANILSGPRTHLVNVVSTFFNGLSYFAAEAARNPKNIPALLYGAARGAKRGAYEAWHTVKTGESPIHISKVETPGTLERQKFVGGWFNPANYLKFVGRLMVAEDVIQFQALKEMRATQLAYKEAAKQGYKNPFGKQVWKTINDKLLNTPERSKAAIEQAQEEGLKPKSVEWKRRVYEIMENSRPIPMTEDAYGFAAKGTFNHEPEGTLGALTTAISHTIDSVNVNGSRPLRFVIPFTRIITNVVNNALDFGPVGLVRGIRGKRGFGNFSEEMTPEERKQIIAKASLGIALTAGLEALTQIPCKDGHNMLEITGGGTGDYKKDAQLKESGWQPFSISICGGDYISYKYTPLIFNLAGLGYWNDNEKYGHESDKSVMGKIATAIYQTGQLALDGTWVKSTSDLMNTLTESRPDQLVSGVKRTLGNMALQTVMPNFYTQNAQQAEEIMKLPVKEAHGFYERLIQHIPIARNSLRDKINALGDTIPTDIDIFKSERKPDKTWDFLNEHKLWVAPINKNSLIVFDQNTQDERPATEDEYYQFSKVRGQKIKQAVNRLIDDGVNITTNGEEQEKSADELTPGELNKIMRKIKTQATKQAKAELFGAADQEHKKPKINIDLIEE